MTVPIPASTPVAPLEALHVLGALALELGGGAAPGRDRLTQAEAGELAGLIANDLVALAPEVAALELAVVGAHYDPVELLRPGWPLHRELDDLAVRAPGRSGERIIAFGASNGQLPGALTPQPDLAGGPLRLVPFVLTGDHARVAPVGELFERELLERGMAGAATALAAQEAFGLAVEHARYLTVHDLAAMTSLQYEHAGLAPLWPVIETALLAPGDEAWLDEGAEPLLHYAGGEARIAMFTTQAWQARYAPELDCATEAAREQAHRLHRHFEARQRQLAAVLQAHGVAVNFVHCDRASDARDALA